MTKHYSISRFLGGENCGWRGGEFHASPPLPQHPFGSMLSQERDGEGKGLWPESKRNRTWTILTTCFIYQRVREIEHGPFSPLVLSTTGSIGITATVVYKRFASLITVKYDKPYSKTIQWIRCRLGYSLFVRCVDPCPHDTILLIIKSLETPLTLPVS